MRIFLALLLMAGPASAVIIQVTKTTDSNGSCSVDCSTNPCTTNCSLRETVGKASPGDVLHLDAATYSIDTAGFGQINLSIPLTIKAQSAATTILSGGDSSGVLFVTNATPVTLSKLTLRDANIAVQAQSGTLAVTGVLITDNHYGFLSSVSATAITNFDNTTIKNSAFRGVDDNGSGSTISFLYCLLSDNGNAAIHSVHAAQIIDTTIEHNSIAGGTNDPSVFAEGTLSVTRSIVRTGLREGVVVNVTSPSVTIDDTTISGNAKNGIFFQNSGTPAGGTYTIKRSTISGNGDSGIATAFGPLTILNSTISGNTAAGFGGGLVATTISPSTVTLNNVTISGNSAQTGGGIAQLSSVTVSMSNSIVSDNTASSGGPDCSGTIGSTGFNLIGSTSGCNFLSMTGDQVGAFAGLGPLANNGGLTQTRGLLKGSAATNAGSNGGGTACAVEDQRHVARPVGARCDIGAYELDRIDTAVSATPNPSEVVPGGTVTFLITAQNLGPMGATNVVVDFTLPTGASFVSTDSVSGSWSCSGTAPVHCTLASLAVGAAAQFHIVVTADVNPGSYQGTAVISTFESELFPSDNTGIGSFTVYLPDLSTLADLVSLPDLSPAPDLSSLEVLDMSVPPDDLSTSTDMSSPDMASPDMASPDMASPDMASPDMAMSTTTPAMASGCKCDLGGPLGGSAPAWPVLFAVPVAIRRRRRGTGARSSGSCRRGSPW